MDTKAFVENTVSRALDKYLELHPDGGGAAIQVSTLPEASAEEEGKIYQFIGATTADYTNGYFYECVEILPATDPKTYQWVQKEVQDPTSIIGSGWGVAKTGVVRINLPSYDGVAVSVDLTDLNLASVDDYNVSVTQCNGNAAWGKTLVYCRKISTTQLSIGAYKNDSDASYIDVSYVVVAKGYGVLGDFDLPTDGDVGQLLAKGDANSNAMVWKDDMGVYLSQYGSQFGIQPAQFSITQVDGEYIEKTGNNYKYKLPRKGVLANVSTTSDFEALVNDRFDLYVKVNGYSYYSHAEYKEQLVTSDLHWKLTGTDIHLDLSIRVDGDNLIFSGNGYEYAPFVGKYYSLDAVRLVAKSGYNFGLTNGTEPYTIRNLTGMVLDDLKVTGTAVPTDWGIATVAKTSISIPSSLSVTQTIDISGFGFESVDDYIVLCNIYNGTGDWAKATTNIGHKSATSFTLIAKAVATDITRVDVEYTIFAKGYGNTTMSAPNAVLESPNGTKYKLIVADDGTLSTETV